MERVLAIPIYKYEIYKIRSFYDFLLIISLKCKPDNDITFDSSYTMRLGTSDLKSSNSHGGTEKMIKEILMHPKYNPQYVHYDVGIAVSSQPIIFTDFVRSVCLPYLPIDNADEYRDKFMTLIGWSYGKEPASEKSPRKYKLTIRNVKVCCIVV